MAKSKADLQEELQLTKEALKLSEREIVRLKTEAQKTLKNEKLKVLRQSNQLQKERDALYAEAKDVYSQSLQIARDVYATYEQQVADNLGLVAKSVREQVLFTLKQVFGDDL